MADDLTVQQGSQGVNPLWPIGGAAIGGVGTYFTADRMTKPKYHQDLINEMKPDEFESTVKNAEDADKAMLEKVRRIRNARAEVVTEMDNELKAIKETAQKPADLPADHQAFKDLKAAQDALASKKNALIEERLAAANQNVSADVKAELQRLYHKRDVVSAPKKQALKDINTQLKGFAEELMANEQRQMSLSNQLAEIQNEIAKNTARLDSEFVEGKFSKNSAQVKGRQFLLNKVRELQAQEAQIKGEIEKIAKRPAEIFERDIPKLANIEVLGLGKDAQARTNFVTEMKNVVDTHKAKIEAESVPFQNLKLAQDYEKIDKVANGVIEKYANAAMQINQKYANIWAEVSDAVARKDKKAMETAIAKLTPEEQEIVNKFINEKTGLIKQADLEKAHKGLAEHIDSKFTTRIINIQEKKSKKSIELLDKLQTAYNNYNANKNDETKKALEEAQTKLRAANNECYDKLLELNKKDKSSDGFKSAIEALKKEQETKFTEFKNASAELEKLEAELKKLGYEGHFQKVNEGGKEVLRLVDAEGNVVKRKVKINHKYLEVGLPKDKELLDIEEKIAELKKKNGVVDRETVAKALQESDYAKELADVKAAEAKVAEAKAALPKPEAIDDTKALERFFKNKGIEGMTKEEYIKKQAEEKSKGLMDEVKTLFERKHGMNNTKLGLLTAAGAVIGLTAAYLLAPKRDQA